MQCGSSEVSFKVSLDVYCDGKTAFDTTQPIICSEAAVYQARFAPTQSSGERSFSNSYAALIGKLEIIVAPCSPDARQRVSKLNLFQDERLLHSIPVTITYADEYYLRPRRIDLPNRSAAGLRYAATVAIRRRDGRVFAVRPTATPEGFDCSLNLPGKAAPTHTLHLTYRIPKELEQDLVTQLVLEAFCEEGTRPVRLELPIKVNKHTKD